MNTEGATVETEEEQGGAGGADQGGQGGGAQGGAAGDSGNVELPEGYDPEEDPGVIQARQQLEYLEGLGFKDTDDYKQLEKNLNEFLGKANKGGSGQGDQGGKGAGDDQGGKGGDGGKGGQKITSSLLGDIETDQGGGKGGAGGGADVGFKTMDDIKAFISGELGLGDDIKAGLEKVKELKAEASQKATIEASLNQLKSGFSKMPEPLLKGISIWGNGGDWKSEIQSALTAPDYTKEFTQLKETEILNHYFPGVEFTEDEISEKKGTYKRSLDAAEKIFAREKSEFEKVREELVNSTTAQTEKFSNSVSESFTKFTTAYPKADNSVAQEIKALMEKDRVMSLFKNNDGTFKDEAFELLFMAKQGKSEVQNLVKALKERNSNFQQVVDRGKDNPDSRGGKGAGDDPNSEKKIVSHFSQYFGTDPYASK